MSAIREEIDPGIKEGKIDINYLVDDQNCPMLNATLKPQLPVAVSTRQEIFKALFLVIIGFITPNSKLLYLRITGNAFDTATHSCPISEGKISLVP